jgi:hypothetical protein
VIPLNDTVMIALEAHPAWYTRQLGECSPEWYVFPAGKGQPNDPTAPVTTLKPLGRKFAIKRKSWEDGTTTATLW